MTRAEAASDAFVAFLHTRGIPYTLEDTGIRVQRHTLDLEEAGLTALPDGLTVQGSLHLSNTRISRIPARLVVTVGLFLEATPISEVPADLVVGDSLWMGGTQLRALPPGFRVFGALHLDDTPLTVLPEGLDVGGYLDLVRTPIRRLPEDMRVGGVIYPPSALLDIQAFMEVHTGANVVRLIKAGSSHEQIAQRAALRAYPDLLQVVTALGPDRQLIIKRLTGGGIDARVWGLPPT